MAQPSIGAEAEASSKANARMRLVLVVLALAFFMPGLAGCGSGSASENGFPNPKPLPVSLTVAPSPVTVAPGSITTFSASPGPPPGFSVVWSVSPATAGTITNSGVFTASGTGGSAMVVASWLPANPLTEKLTTGSASVTVLQPVATSPSLTQASGGIQTAGSIENGTIAGQGLATVNSTDPTGNVQARSGFPVPVPCPTSNPNCN